MTKQFIINAEQARTLQSILGLNTGYTLENGRDIICQYKYPQSPTFKDFYAIGNRTGLGAAVIKHKVEKCWSTTPVIKDVTKFDDNGKPLEWVESEFTKKLNEIANSRKIQFWERLKTLDLYQRYGRYAAAVITVREVGGDSAEKELLAASELVKITPYYEAQMLVSEWDMDASSESYGDPKMWQLMENNIPGATQGQMKTGMYHPSRVIAASEGAGDGSIFGKSALQDCIYACMDYEKARMASAEGIKRNNDQRYIVSIEDGSNMPKGEEAEAFDENQADFDNGDASSLMVAGANVSALNASFHDPKSVADMCINEAAAADGTPATILIGQQTGRLASAEDRDTDANNCQQRREGFCNELIFQFLDRFIDTNILPEPKGKIVIEWDDLREPSLRDKLEMVDKMATVNEKAFRTGAGVAFEINEMREVADYEAIKQPGYAEEGELDFGDGSEDNATGAGGDGAGGEQA